VLDSICFVLGISNLSQVRASSLQELVYKGGQAGITKATVTLVFDNEDKVKSPVGYEPFAEITVTRQIVIGGRNKYLINGHVAPPTRVQNLFHLVGLNVNNPHFLIMQGRITKVINMKPPELLSMIEEAAGTKMYENKKEAALKTIEKKARKVEEINSLLTDKINPSLAKLEKERKHYMEWNQNNNDMDLHTRYVTAYEYLRASSLVEQGEDERTAISDKADELKDTIRDLASEKNRLDSRLAALSKEHRVLAGTGEFETLEDEVTELDKKFTRSSGLLNNQTAALAAEQATLETLVASIADAKRTQGVNTIELESNVNSAVNIAEAAQQAAFEKMESAETALLTGTCTQTTQASGTGSAIDQLEAAKRAVSQATSELESLKLRTAHLKAQLKDKSAKLANNRADVRALEAEKKRAEKAISDAKLAVHELDFDHDSAQAVSVKLSDEKSAVATLHERVDQLSARLSAFDFQFASPRPGFDRRRVMGTVATLLRVNDLSKATALEVTAGGRLYQVVVDSDVTGKDLLKGGSLTRRVTILPLNKIRHDTLPRRQLDRAKQIEPSCELALHLVRYEADVSNAMEHVFGRTLICLDMEAAKRVTFDTGVRTRSVTLDGDVFDPSGTLSGGSNTRGSQQPILVLLSELADAKTELLTRESNVSRLSAQLEGLDSKSRRYRKLNATLDIKQDEARLLADRLSTSVTGRLLTEVEQLHKDLSETIPAAVKEAKAILVENEERVSKLEDDLENADSARDRVRMEAEAAMKTIKSAYVDAIAACQEVKDRRDSLVVQIESLGDDVARLEQQRKDIVEPAVDRLKTEIEELHGKAVREKDRLQDAKKRLDDERSRLLESNTAISSVNRTLEELSESSDASTLELTKLQGKLRDAERNRTGAKRLVERLDAQHAWITQDSVNFGVAGTEYEFDSNKVKSARAILESLQQRQECLSKKINKKAMHMFETAKDEYNSLVQKKRIIEDDKEKIQDVIAGLDEKKMVALDRTWKEVNSSFGKIFSELLPGTSAKLEPPTGKAVHDGLEIRVAFGAVWKDSLSELSGGQRSLIALSLILAMLRFKPAPMYILDEVDAALDLSHTQNIGRMLRKHFSGSQFIVVSLKEGMFQNANVIFRTRFVDGTSAISRSVNNVSRLDDDDEDEYRRGTLRTISGGLAVANDKENDVSGAPIGAEVAAGRKRRSRA
jgi:structural maintenance of chromosome 2